MPAERIISLAALTVLELVPPKMVEVAARCGYSHVGLRPIAATPTEHHFPLLTDAALRAETKACLEDAGVGVLDIEILRLKPETDVAEFEAALEFGAEFGARFALVAGNDPDVIRMSDNLAVLAELAAPYHITPHLEFMPWTDVPTLGSAMAVSGRANHSNVGILVDAFHLNRSCGAPDDIPPNDPRFGYVQLCDISGPVPADMGAILQEARAERLFPGEGDCPLIALLARLPSDIPISIETPATQKNLSAEDRVRAALDATRRVLALAAL